MFVVSSPLLATLLTLDCSSSSTSRLMNPIFGPPSSRRHINPTHLVTIDSFPTVPRPQTYNSLHAPYLSCPTVSISLRPMPRFMIPLCAYTNHLIPSTMPSTITLDTLLNVYWLAFCSLPPTPSSPCIRFPTCLQSCIHLDFVHNLLFVLPLRSAVPHF